MTNQLTFGGLAFAEKKKKTKREEFLDEMQQVVPWSWLCSIIEPYYPKAGNGRRPFELECMFRIYCMQQWFQLSDPGMEDALYDSRSMTVFAGIEEGKAVPDETTILKFRHLLERHQLTERIFAAIHRHIEERGLVLRTGTILDATIIHAASSTKNRDEARDPEMSSTKKGNQWHFGMKAHIGVDSHSGVVHSVVCTTASVHDSDEAENLLHGEELAAYGDKAYASAARKEEYERRGIRYNITTRAARNRELTPAERRWNKCVSRVRARVEHVFGVVKNLWGYRKVRYRGIYKNACQQFGLFGLANLYLVRRQLLKT